MPGLTYTAEELATELGISKSHVYRMARAGDLPVLAIPGRTLFARAAIDRWIDAQTRRQVA